MADKIQKALAKLSPKERLIVATMIKKLLSGDLMGMDIRQLVGNPGIFRLKKGRIRVIFSKTEVGDLTIIGISRRDDKTYRDFN